MPWTYDDPPKPALNWPESETRRCVDAANQVLDGGGNDEEAIFACIAAAGKGSKAVADLYLTPPKGAKDNAQKVLNWRDEHGDEVEGMTRVGWTRANQLAKGERLSPETVKRMASFNRHRQNGELSEEFRSTPWKDAGYVAWLGWGGTVGIDWALRMSDKIDEEREKSMQLKHKTFDFKVINTKEVERDGQKYGQIKGYASTFGNVDRGGDRIMRGAFDRTIEDHMKRQRPIRMLYQHNMNEIIGGFTNYYTDDKGLYVEGEINLDVQRGKEAYALAKQGVLSDMSIGYKIVDGEYQEDGNQRIYDLKEVELFEISVVGEPMNQEAVITQVKSIDNIRDVEAFLKSKGLSNREAKAVISKVSDLKQNTKACDEPSAAEREALAKLDDAIYLHKINLRLSKLEKEIKL